MRVRHRFARSRRREAQQNVSGFDLLSFARNGFDLQRLVVIGEDRSGFELAVVLEKNVHGGVKQRGDRDYTGASSRALTLPLARDRSRLALARRASQSSSRCRQFLSRSAFAKV